MRKKQAQNEQIYTKHDQITFCGEMKRNSKSAIK